MGRSTREVMNSVSEASSETVIDGDLSIFLQKDVVKIEDRVECCESSAPRFTTLFLPKISVESFYGATSSPRKLESIAKRDFQTYEQHVSRVSGAADLLLKKIAVDNLKEAIESGLDEEVTERLDRLRPALSDGVHDMLVDISFALVED